MGEASTGQMQIRNKLATLRHRPVYQLPDTMICRNGCSFFPSIDQRVCWGATLASGRLTGSLEAWDTRLSRAFSSTMPSIFASISEASCCHTCARRHSSDDTHACFILWKEKIITLTLWPRCPCLQMLQNLRKMMLLQDMCIYTTR